jgi:hypothetical protein
MKLKLAVEWQVMMDGASSPTVLHATSSRAWHVNT